MPSTATRPPLRSRKPSRISTVVVLPAPLGPSRPKTSPRRTVNEMPRTACVGRRSPCADPRPRWRRRRASAVHHGNLPPSVHALRLHRHRVEHDAAAGRRRRARAARARWCSSASFTRIGRAIGRDGAIPPATIAEVADGRRARSARPRRAPARERAARRRHGRDPARRQPRRAARARCASARGVEVDVAARRGRGAARVPRRDAHARRRRRAGTVAVVDVGGDVDRDRGRHAGRRRDAGRARSRSARARSPAGCRGRPAVARRPRARCARPRAAAFAGARRSRPPTDAVAVGGSAASLPTLVGPVLDAAALRARARRARRGARRPRSRALHGLAPERTQLLPAGILVLGAAAERLGRPLRIGRGGLREGVILELAAPT